MNIKIGEKIKDLRMAKNITQAEFAKRIGVTTSAVSSYEVSARQPSYDVLVKIAKLFNVTTDYLLGFGGEDIIDITGLTVQQRNSVQDLIKTHKEYNKAMEKLWENGFCVSDEPFDGEITIVSIEPIEKTLKRIKKKE